MEMELVYVIGPYRAETHYQVGLNIQNARMAAARLWEKGYAVICPHLNTAFFGGVCEEMNFLDGGIVMLKRCDWYYPIDGWHDSVGSCMEVEIAENLGIKRLLLEEDK